MGRQGRRMSRHSFDPDIAAQVGLNAAVIYQNVLWWCEKNAANGDNIHDGKAWTYNSVAAFAVLFPYLTAKQIRTALDSLIEKGLVMVGNYNKDARDRTRWYAITRQLDLPQRASTFAQEGAPLPVSKPVINEEKIPPTPTAAAPSIIKARLPEGWWMTEDDMKYAQDMQIHYDDIKEIADDFYGYWAERTDASGKKSARGWSQAWRNRCRDIAPQYRRNRNAQPSRADATLQAIAFAGRAGRAPSEDSF